jgi:hypothetical protein
VCFGSRYRFAEVEEGFREEVGPRWSTVAGEGMGGGVLVVVVLV